MYLAGGTAFRILQSFLRKLFKETAFAECVETVRDCVCFPEVTIAKRTN